MIVRVIVLIAVVLVAGCAGIPQDDRYQTHDGGRSNTRAEVPAGCTSTGTTGGGGGYSPKGSRGGGWENFRAEMPMTAGSMT